MKTVILSIYNPLDYDEEYIEEEGFSGRRLDFLDEDGDSVTDWQGFLDEEQVVENLVFQVNENDPDRDCDEQWSGKEEVEGNFGDPCDQESEGIDFSKGYHGDGPVMKAKEWAAEEGGIEHIRLSSGSGSLQCEIEMADDEHFEASKAHLYKTTWELPDGVNSYVVSGIVYEEKYYPFVGEIEPEQEMDIEEDYDDEEENYEEEEE